MSPSLRPLIAAGTLLGAGMGGFLDGIVFHQLLQFHNMLSAKYPPNSVVNLEVNMFWDGLFHLFTWLMTAAGIFMLWRATAPPTADRSTRGLLGSLAFGWGLFNLIEGFVNHHLLELHHVREVDNHQLWDLAFLAFGAVMALVGMALLRAAVVEHGPAN